MESSAMRLGLNLGYAPPGTNPADLFPLVEEAERLGFDSVWVAEAWGTDAVSVLGWLAARTETIKLGSAIMQIPGRTPANAAMTAATLDLLSGGRFLLGLGTSGPQVAEGWHGQPWGKPLGKTREYVEIVRAALHRERVEHEGDHYRIPWDGPGATGLGKPLKLMLRPLRSEIPIYLAALGPKNVALAAEIADGWLALFTDPQKVGQVYGGALAGAPPGFDIAATVNVILTDDMPAALHTAKQTLGFYIGGMGARTRNFHLDVVTRMGYEEAGRRVQELFLDGRRDEAIDAVPDELADAVCLLGPIARIRERLQLWRDSPVTTLLVTGPDSEPELRAIRDAVLG
jgi:F420-dependent oxidoreductase-like protein